MNLQKFAALFLGLSLLSPLSAKAQDLPTNLQYSNDEVTTLSAFFDDDERIYESDSIAPDGRRWADIPDYELVGMALDTLIYVPPLPSYFFRPIIYDHYEFVDSIKLDKPVYSDRPWMRWLEEQELSEESMKQLNKYVLFNNPELVKYNRATMLTAPKYYETVLNPVDHTIEIREIPDIKNNQTTLVAEEVKKRHWIRTFNASLQFSQAYVSPNWYQGGNNNVNMLGQLYYNVKLNTEYHPDLLFDFTAQYKLGINSAPDDTIRNYSISDDLLQLNATFGIKAANHWYYSFTGQFKTQVLNSYTSNTRNLRSAFLSPGELTAGVGMTYNYTNQPKTFTFDASIAPISYNLKICTNPKLDETAYGIKPGDKTVSKYGSSAELKLFWQMARNISLRSRLFAFSDYSHAQADWENTLQFEINKFLTTQIYAHLRYDTRGVSAEGTKWKKLQLKEILSIGFAYKFSSI
ncbi:MAG: DUF3078 domain-containing protein [Muribaculaceae bacterium]|nr:DUF3078 domain-containing protein [Muribaculaceae bacterium]MDE7458703.1 DUF3078 domain-containing protein [Muribaculaceae bacterium]